MTAEEREELTLLRNEWRIYPLGDRPSSPCAKKIRRLFELEELERKAKASAVL